MSKVGEIVGAAMDAGMAIGIYTPTTGAAARWLAMGATLVAITADVHMALEGFKSYRRALEVADH